MRVLVTGADGFVGGHAARELEASGHEVIRVFGARQPEAEAPVVDVRDAEALDRLVRENLPEACIHLAGLAFIPLGWKNPNLCFEVNLHGTINLLEAFRNHAPTARLLVVSSAEVYGRRPSPVPLDESAPFLPENIYALSKFSADSMTLLYARRYGMHTMTARPQNHVGPGQSTQFVFPTFARQITRIAGGLEEAVMHVGNLDAVRDFTDVRDVARAYRLLIESGSAGLAFNISSEQNVRIGHALDFLLGLAGIKPEIRIDEDRYRPTDTPPIISTSRIRSEVGWVPEIPLEQTLTDIYAEALQALPGC